MTDLSTYSLITIGFKKIVSGRYEKGEKAITYDGCTWLYYETKDSEPVRIKYLEDLN